MLSARLIRGPFAVDDMVHVMLHSRSTTCSIRGRDFFGSMGKFSGSAQRVKTEADPLGFR
jgi:hypothetical protein